MSETTLRPATRVENPDLHPLFMSDTVNVVWQTEDGYYTTSWAPGDDDFPAHTAGWDSDEHGWPAEGAKVYEGDLIYVDGEDPDHEAVLAKAGYEVVGA